MLLPQTLDDLDERGMAELVRSTYSEIVGDLTRPLGVTSVDSGLLRELQADPEDTEAVWAESSHRGWSDGPPVIPPTLDRVQRTPAGRDPDQVHVVLAQRRAPRRDVRRRWPSWPPTW